MTTYLILAFAIFRIATLSVSNASNLNNLQASTVKQSLRLFAGFGCTTSSLTVNGSVANLHSKNFSNAKSFLSTGMWIFYSKTDFNKNGGNNRAREAHFYRSMKCQNFQIIPGNVASVRFAGFFNNYTKSSISFFQLEKYDGNQQFLTGRESKLKYEFGKTSSAIITGKDNWTVFDQINFQGKSTCLNSTSRSGRSPTKIEFLGDAVRSVASGCPPKKNI